MSQRSAPRYEYRLHTDPQQLHPSSTYSNSLTTYSKYAPTSSSTTTTPPSSATTKNSHRRSFGDSTIFPSESPFKNYNSPIASPPHKPSSLSSTDMKRRSLNQELIKSPPRELSSPSASRFSSRSYTHIPSSESTTRTYSKGLTGTTFGSSHHNTYTTTTTYDRSQQISDKQQYNNRTTIETDSPLKSIKKFEFEAMYRKNFKYIEKCLLIASESDFQTFGVRTSSLPTCLEMGIQLLYRVIDPSKITSSLIDNILQLGAFQDPQQGIMDVESFLRVNDRFNKLLDIQASSITSCSDLVSLSSKVDRVLETKRRTCLLLLQQNEQTKIIYSNLDQEFGEIVHVVFDPHSQKTNTTLHGASALILIGNNVKKYLNEWLDFSPNTEIEYTLFFRRPEEEFFKFSFEKTKVKEVSAVPSNNNISELKKKIDNERKTTQDLLQRLEEQQQFISNLEMEIAQMESDYSEDSKNYATSEKTRRILTEVLHLLSSSNK